MSEQLEKKFKSPLSYHRILAPSAAVRVSPLCLGGMAFGDAWPWMGCVSKAQTYELLDHFFENGGNFVDTANAYQSGQSEQWIGDWMDERGTRDQMVIATKYTGASRLDKVPGNLTINFAGNHAKSMHLSLEQSLKQLKTSYIDLFYVHWWDFTTSIYEVMRHLHRFVMQGKVLYLGISDTPAWIVSKANEYARAHGLTPFSVYQGQWSAADRDFERDILPMVHEEGMGLAPWGVLGSGNIRTVEQRQAVRAEANARQMLPATDKDVAVSNVLEAIANRKQTALTSVALAYVMHKAPYSFPIVGCRKLEYLKANIEALRLELSEEDVDEIEAAVPFDVGFPMRLLFHWHGGSKKGYSTKMTASDIRLTAVGGDFDSVEKPRPIRPRTALETLSSTNLMEKLDMRKAGGK